MMPNDHVVFVPGKPEPKGSPRIVPRGRTGKMISCKTDHGEVWEQSIIAEWRSRGLSPVDGAVSVGLLFLLPRPKSTSRAYPHARPDLDKLARAVLDALTRAGAYPDDARVVRVIAEKHYIEPYGYPGVLIELCPMREASLPIWLQVSVKREPHGKDERQ